MTEIKKKVAPTSQEVTSFIETINFNIPQDFISFFEESNGGTIVTDEYFIVLWPLTEMIQLNKDYSITENAPEFFAFGSDGAGMAYAIEKQTGFIYEMPFIGISKEDAVLLKKTFLDFIR